MPQKRNPKKERIAARRAGRAVTPTPPPGGSGLAPLARSAPMHEWQLLECLVSATWQQPGDLVQILIARHSESGEIGAAAIIVDLGCLGVKNAIVQRFTNYEHYDAELRGM